MNTPGKWYSIVPFGGRIHPAGVIYLIDEDGKFLIDEDGKYLILETPI